MSEYSNPNVEQDGPAIKALATIIFMLVGVTVGLAYFSTQIV